MTTIRAKKYSTECACTYVFERLTIVKQNLYVVCVDGDTNRAVYYNGLLLCNETESTAQRMCEGAINNTDWNCQVVFMDVIFVIKKEPNKAIWEGI